MGWFVEVGGLSWRLKRRYLGYARPIAYCREAFYERCRSMLKSISTAKPADSPVSAARRLDVPRRVPGSSNELAPAQATGHYLSSSVNQYGQALTIDYREKA